MEFIHYSLNQRFIKNIKDIGIDDLDLLWYLRNNYFKSAKFSLKNNIDWEEYGEICCTLAEQIQQTIDTHHQLF